MIIRNVARRAGRPALSAHPWSPRALLTTESTTAPGTRTAADLGTAPAEGSHAESTAQPAAYAGSRPAWGQRKQLDNTAAQDFITMTRLQRKTSRLGSTVVKGYVPGDQIRDPPKPRDVTLELLMASQTHVGHSKALWNPENLRYIHGVRNGVHIISLEQTALHLRRAARVVEEIAYRAGLVLFVGTRRGQTDIVVRAAQLAGGCHVFSKWTPGMITNRDKILNQAPMGIVDEQDTEQDLEALLHIPSEELSSSGDKEVDPAELDGARRSLLPLRPVAPDLVVVLNPLENFVLLHECALANIPTVGIIDTNADPTRVTYPIPANDDSLRSVALIGGVLGRAGEIGRRRRLRDAEQGVVAWQNTPVMDKILGKKAENKDVGYAMGIMTARRRNWLLRSGAI